MRIQTSKFSHVENFEGNCTVPMRKPRRREFYGAAVCRPVAGLTKHYLAGVFSEEQNLSATLMEWRGLRAA
jgi:hypothetical protein